ncbi:DUF551 domain-containing protein [Pseudomonas sp. zfem002]|uniref:DUF551 domain-containing protein n=1 Tax=Pseudomonas sp. zfem002 TaxID=3078197 RepID=UPI002927B287|nr:DUF551 domain-containing protein [Pseudomonas sp. zfem002]MDU9394590.1 DUF551 domain-containing protein [Pseudomonas sp. zfem002]
MSQWIKCSDRLPGNELNGMAVIISVSHCSRGLIAETDVWLNAKRGFAFWGNRVSHWQPLPAPPGAEQ